jgi:Mrp family chromosome partitioning ATPase
VRRRGGSLASPVRSTSDAGGQALDESGELGLPPDQTPLTGPYRAHDEQAGAQKPRAHRGDPAERASERFRQAVRHLSQGVWITVEMVLHDLVHSRGQEERVEEIFGGMAPIGVPRQPRGEEVGELGEPEEQRGRGIRHCRSIRRRRRKRTGLHRRTPLHRSRVWQQEARRYSRRRGVVSVGVSGGLGQSGELPAGALFPYVRALRSHVWLAVLVLVAVVLGSVGWLVVREPVFEASARLLVTPLPEDERSFFRLPLVRESGDPTRTLQTAASLADTAQAASVAARRVGGGWSEERVRDAVEVVPEGESSILAIRARAESAELAARLANAFAEAVITSRRRLLRGLVERAIASVRVQLAERGSGPGAGALAERLADLEAVRDGTDPTMQVSELAQRPDTASQVKAPVVIALALVAGSVLAAAAALLMELFAPRPIRDEQELLALYPLPVLARVPQLPRRAQRQSRRRRARGLPPPQAADVSEAFRFLHAQLQLTAGPHRVITFTSPSSGDGKTTSVALLAQELGHAGRTVTALDLDFRTPTLAAQLGVTTEHDIAETLQNGGQLKDALTTIPQLPSVKLAAANTNQNGAGLAPLLPQLPNLIEQALATADHVLIDTPPIGEISDGLQIARETDDLIIVCRLGNTRPPNLQATRDILQRTRLDPTGYLIIGGAPLTSRHYL